MEDQRLEEEREEVTRPEKVTKRVTRQQTRLNLAAEVEKLDMTNKHERERCAKTARNYDKCDIVKIGMTLLMLIFLGFLAHSLRAMSIGEEGRTKPKSSRSPSHSLNAASASASFSATQASHAPSFSSSAISSPTCNSPLQEMAAIKVMRIKLPELNEQDVNNLQKQD